MFRSFRILVMVVIVLLTASSLFAVAALISHDQVLADSVAPSPSSSASPMPTSTIDPNQDIAKYKNKARKIEKKTKKVYIELVKRAHALNLGKVPPKRKLPGSSFDTWEERFRYDKDRLKAFRQLNHKYWRAIRHPKAKSGTDRWVPLLRYCGMPQNQMWHALQIMGRESHGDPTAKNKHSTASGLFQFLADWWRNKKTGGIKWNPFDPYQNILHFVRAILGSPGWSPWALIY